MNIRLRESIALSTFLLMVLINLICYLVIKNVEGMNSSSVTFFQIFFFPLAFSLLTYLIISGGRLKMNLYLLPIILLVIKIIVFVPNYDSGFEKGSAMIEISASFSLLFDIAQYVLQKSLHHSGLLEQVLHIGLVFLYQAAIVFAADKMSRFLLRKYYTKVNSIAQ